MIKVFNSDIEWPTPNFNENNQPHFLFIITPPYSGSTALVKFLNTSHRTMLLEERGEGQRLVPGLFEKGRWNPNKQINYNSIKAVWLNKFQEVQRLTHIIDVVLEKSPPNMMRIEKLVSNFQDYSFLVNVRNPYANCASILYRVHDGENLKLEQRIKILRNLGNFWIMMAEQLKKLTLKLDLPLVTYERFCENPSSILDKLHTPKGVWDLVDSNAKIKVKDYKPQLITNMNQRQISNLTDTEIKELSTIF